MVLDPFGLRIPLRRETRFRLGVPIVELWVADHNFIFRRVTGIWDSGASQTLLTTSTYLHFLKHEKPLGAAKFMYSVSGRRISYHPCLLQFRVGVPHGPAMHFPLIAGVSKDVVENIFGGNMSDYFSALIQHDRVVLLADERIGAGD